LILYEFRGLETGDNITRGTIIEGVRHDGPESYHSSSVKSCRRERTAAGARIKRYRARHRKGDEEPLTFILSPEAGARNHLSN
jgi:hypothetical protein